MKKPSVLNKAGFNNSQGIQKHRLNNFQNMYNRQNSKQELPEVHNNGRQSPYTNQSKHYHVNFNPQDRVNYSRSSIRDQSSEKNYDYHSVPRSPDQAMPNIKNEKLNYQSVRNQLDNYVADNTHKRANSVTSDYTHSNKNMQNGSPMDSHGCKYTYKFIT